MTPHQFRESLVTNLYKQAQRETANLALARMKRDRDMVIVHSSRRAVLKELLLHYYELCMHDMQPMEIKYQDSPSQMCGWVEIKRSAVVIDWPSLV